MDVLLSLPSIPVVKFSPGREERGFSGVPRGRRETHTQNFCVARQNDPLHHGSGTLP